MWVLSWKKDQFPNIIFKRSANVQSKFLICAWNIHYNSHFSNKMECSTDQGVTQAVLEGSQDSTENGKLNNAT